MRFLSCTLTLWVAQLLFVEATTPPNPVQVSLRSDDDGRYEHCSVYCPSLDTLLVIGGIGVSHPELFNFKTEEWSAPRNVSGSPPQVERSCYLSLLESSEEGCKVILIEGQKNELLDARVAKLSVTLENYFELEWFENENPERSGPPGRLLYCATSLENRIYVLGGHVAMNSTKDQLTDEFWEVEVGFNSSTGNVTANWTNLSTGDTNAPTPLAGCGLTSTDSDKLVLYGGSEMGNEMRYYDVSTKRWTKPFETSSTGTFVRDGPSLTFYDKKVYMYGGGMETDFFVFPSPLYSMTPSNNPKSNCSNVDNISKDTLWCMYDESLGRLPIHGVYRHSCVLRQSQMVCTFGENFHIDQASRRMIMFDLDIIKNHLRMGDEVFWMPLDVSWEPVIAYMVVCIFVTSYLFHQSKQSNRSWESLLLKVLDNHYYKSEKELLAEFNASLRARTQDGHSKNNTGRSRVSIATQYKIFINTACFMFGGVALVSVSLTIRSDPVPLMVLNVLMNLFVTYTFTHWLVWFMVVRKRQALGETNVAYYFLDYDVTNRCTRYIWKFVELLAMAAISVMSAFSWFQVEKYFDLNKTKPGFFVLNFYENTLFTVLSIPLCCAAAVVVCHVAFWILSAPFEIIDNAFIKGYPKAGTGGVNGSTDSIENTDEDQDKQTIVPQETISTKQVEDDDTDIFGVSSIDECDDTFIGVTKNGSDMEHEVLVKVVMKSDTDNFGVSSSEEECDDTSNDATKNTSPENSESDEEIGVSRTYAVLCGLPGVFFVNYYFSGIFSSALSFLPYFCIPGNFFAWIYFPCRVVYRLFDQLVVEKERNENSDRVISKQTSFTWFFLVMLVLAAAITMLTLEYLQVPQLYTMLEDGRSVQYIFYKTWVIWVLSAPTIITGASAIVALIVQVSFAFAQLCIEFLKHLITSSISVFRD